MSQNLVYLMPQSDFWPFGAKNKQEDNVDFSGQSVLLQKQLGDMEGEVKEIQMELAAIRRIRQDGKTNVIEGVVVESHDGMQETKPSEPYPRYQEEKYTKEQAEVSKLREDLIRAKNAAEEERFQRLKYEAKLKDLELKLNDICTPGKTIDLKESRKITEDEVAGLKSQIRDLKEQIEEMTITDDEKTEQLQEYRVKYLQAQQQVEELKRQIDVMEFDNKTASDQIHLELHKMKFQEKLLELAPLPDLLKGAQIQLQEAKQLQKLAEENTQQITNELHRVKEKLVLAVNNFNQEKIERCKLAEDNEAYRSELEDKQREIDALTKEVEDYRCSVLRLEEKLHQLEIRYDEKVAENSQLAKDMEELKEESTRSLNRMKERADSTRHYLQTQIAGYERQIITRRAQCRSYQKERDEIRQRTQIQISSLKENFDMVQVRLRGLQRQIGLLKHCYSITMQDDVEDTTDPESFATAYGPSQQSY